MEDREGGGALRPSARLRLYQELERQLNDYIVENKLQVGDRLPPERELAVRLGVSRTSLRQAMVALEVKGVVEVRHGDGTYLKDPLTDCRKLEPLEVLFDRRQRLPDVLEVRETLESRIAELAALRRTVRDLKSINRALKTMDDEIAHGGLGHAGDAKFHAAVAAASHNNVFVYLMDALAQPITETRVESLREPGRPPRSLAAHQRIADAIEARDPLGASEAMRAHVKQVTDVRLLRWNP